MPSGCPEAATGKMKDNDPLKFLSFGQAEIQKDYHKGVNPYLTRLPKTKLFLLAPYELSNIKVLLSCSSPPVHVLFLFPRMLDNVGR